MAAGTATVNPTGDDYVDGLINGTKWVGKVGYDVNLRIDGVNNYAQYAAVQAMTSGIFQWPEGDEIYNPHNGLVQKYNNVKAFTNLEIFQYFPDLSVSKDIKVEYGDIGADLFTSPPPLPPLGFEDSAFMILSTAHAGTDQDLRLPVMGNYAYALHLKGLGATLGLKSASEAGGVADVAVPQDRDSLEYTVMSDRAHVGGPVNDWADVEQYGHPQTFMALDILALQTLYGADYSYNARNTSYSWDPATGQMSVNRTKLSGTPTDNKLFMTIWDGGGIDIYNLQNYTTGVIVDLEPGAATFTSEAQRAYLGGGVYAKGSIYNSYLYNDNPASLIENVIAGSGNDTLRGNAANNTLNGGAGADAMAGRAGDDSYVIDNAGDTVVEAANEGTDTLFVRASSYVLPANVENAKAEIGFGNVELWGNAGGNLLAGNGANNDLYGNAGADVLYGMDGSDHLDGGAGPDQMIGGVGNDTYIVDNFSDVVFEKPNEGYADMLWTSVSRGLDNDFENIALFGSATDAGGNSKNNIVSGNERGNNLYGAGGSDSLYGHDGSDRLFGEDGNDYMTGGKGTDAYYGGAGYDYAILEQGGGVDYFTDFKASEDRVVFDSDIFSSIGAAMNAAFQSGTDVVIWDGQDGIVLQNAKVADLTTSNFLFT